MTTPGVDPSGTTPGNPVSPAGAPAGSPASGSVTSGYAGRSAARGEAGRPSYDPARTPPRGMPSAARTPGPSPAQGAQPGVARTYDPGPPPAGSRPPAPAPARTTGTVTPAATRVRRRPGTRKARLRLTRVDPWSALKTSLVFSGFLFVVWMVAVFVLYLVLLGAGTFDAINQTLTSVFGQRVSFNGGVILGGAAVIGALSVVLVCALGTVLAFAYNVTASLMGGVDVTLTESEG